MHRFSAVMSVAHGNEAGAVFALDWLILAHGQSKLNGCAQSISQSNTLNRASNRTLWRRFTPTFYGEI